jgi:hypothetical protein
MAMTSSIETSATGTWSQLIPSVCGAHRGELRRQITLDNAVGMGNPAVGAFAGCNVDQLLRGGDDGGLGLPERRKICVLILHSPVFQPPCPD